MQPESTAAQQEQLFRVRPATATDLPFILATWLESFWRESMWAHRLTAKVYFGEYRPIIVGLLQRSVVLVVESADGQLLGDIVYDPTIPAAHWIYVLKAWRRLGIGRALFAATGLPADLSGVRVTHPTRSWFTTQARTTANGKQVGGPGLEERFKAINDPCLPFHLVLGGGLPPQEQL